MICHAWNYPMTSPPSHDVTRLLNGLGRSPDATPDRLLPLVYDELRALAQHQLQRERPGHTLQATALVHEAYLRLVDQTRIEFAGRSHFFAIAATMIRRILVDHARGKAAAKRGGQAGRLTLHEDAAAINDDRGVDLLDLDDALTTLAALSDRQARVVELRFFGGLTVEEAADVLDVSPRTVKDDWRIARAWLRQRLTV